MITKEIKDILTPAVQTWLRVKTLESKFVPELDYVKNYADVIQIEIDDATHMMTEYLKRIKSENGKEIYLKSLDWCKEIIESSYTKRTIISAFKNAKYTEPINIQLSTFLESTKHLDKIQAIRNTTTKEEKDELKKMLPCATISGTFTKRSIEGIKNYNGLVCLDFDGKDNEKTPNEIKAILKDFDEVLYCGLSVSGNGIFAILATDNTDFKAHSKVVDALGEMFKKFGLIHDKGCKDISRLRFVSHDTEGYLNEDAIQYQTGYLLAENAVQPKKHIDYEFNGDNRSRTVQIVEKYLSVIQSTNVDLTDNYDDWVKIGFAIASEFGYDGEDYFVTVSQNSPKFDYVKCSKKYEHFVKAGRRSGIGAFINICKRNNILIQ